MGSTSLQVYEIGQWGGINLKDDPKKISPGEFVDLANFNTSEGSIKLDKVDALIDMPVSNVLYNGVGNLNKEGTNAPGVSGGNSYFGLYFSEVSLASGDSVGVGVPFYVSGIASADLTSAGAEWLGVELYSNASASDIPSADIGAGDNIGIGYCDIPASSSGFGLGSFVMTREVMATGAVGSADGFWLLVNRAAMVSGTKGEVYASGTVVQKSTTAGITTATASWTLNSDPWSCVVTKNTNSAGGHVLNIFPFFGVNERKNVEVQAGTGTDYYYGMADLDALSFSKLHVSAEPTYKNSLICSGYANRYEVNRYRETTVSSVAYLQNDFNLIELSGGSSFLSVPNSVNPLLIDFNPDYKINAWKAYRKQTRKNQHCVFQNYIVLARNGALCAYEMVLDIGKHVIKTKPLKTPDFVAARGVVAYNNYLIFYNLINTDGTAYRHRMYFSTAGNLDDFSATQFENLSDGQEILWIEEWFGSLIIFFANKIKRYTGTPGNASLETIFYKGPYCAEVICKTPIGLVFLANDGLYVYNGTFTKVDDKSDYFNDATALDCIEDGWMEFNDKKKELYFYTGYSSTVISWNIEKNIFRRKLGLFAAGTRFFSYYDNANLKLAVSYPGIDHVSEIEGGSTYTASILESGWIDVSEGKTAYEKKHFDSIVFECDKALGDATFDLYVYTEDVPGTAVTETVTVPGGTAGTSYIHKASISKDAVLIKYKIMTVAQTYGINITKIKIFYNDTILR